MLKAKDLRDQSIQELERTYSDERRKLFELVSQLRAQKKREKPHEIYHTRKNIARLLTVLNEKRRQEQQ